jgi:hypothetical protein
MWRKKMEAMKERERTMTTNGSLGLVKASTAVGRRGGRDGSTGDVYRIVTEKQRDGGVKQGREEVNIIGRRKRGRCVNPFPVATTAPTLTQSKQRGR